MDHVPRRDHRCALGLLAAALLVGGCTGPRPAPAGPHPTASAVASSRGPFIPPLDDDGVRITLVRAGGGDPDQAASWLAGARTQAAAAGIELTVLDAGGDGTRHEADLRAALASAPDGIVIEGGDEELDRSALDAALAAGVPVVAHDVPFAPAPGLVLTRVSQESMAEVVLGAMAVDVGPGAPVGLVASASYLRMDRQIAVWDDVLAQQGWTQVVTEEAVEDPAMIGRYLVLDLEARPDVEGVFAPSEVPDGVGAGEVAEAVATAGATTTVYGSGLSAAGIAAMTAPGSAWVATSTTDPTQAGAAVVRVMALALAGTPPTGDGPDGEILLPAVLVTQDELREQGITTPAELAARRPDVHLDAVATADWLLNAVP